MMCWKDRAYCKHASECANSDKCGRYISDAEQARAAHEGYPVCWLTDKCDKYRKKDVKEASDGGVRY